MNRITTHPIGEKFWFWTVLGVAPRTKQMLYYIVECECGVVKEVQRVALLNGKTKSCGCQSRRMIAESRTSHGASTTNGRTPEYRAWLAMKNRCSSPKSQQWGNYGGRGITVCERWLNSFENFLEDMGPRPGPGYSLDREDNEKGYSPDNCRWATAKTQLNNRRANHYLEYEGQSMTLTQWAEKLGMATYVLKSRIKNGWTVARAFNEPVKSRK